MFSLSGGLYKLSQNHQFSCFLLCYKLYYWHEWPLCVYALLILNNNMPDDLSAENGTREAREARTQGMQTYNFLNLSIVQ
jgi:hypothetical protein